METIYSITVYLEPNQHHVRNTIQIENSLQLLICTVEDEKLGYSVNKLAVDTRQSQSKFAIELDPLLQVGLHQ